MAETPEQGVGEDVKKLGTWSWERPVVLPDGSCPNTDCINNTNKIQMLEHQLAACQQELKATAANTNVGDTSKADCNSSYPPSPVDRTFASSVLSGMDVDNKGQVELAVVIPSRKRSATCELPGGPQSPDDEDAHLRERLKEALGKNAVLKDQVERRDTRYTNLREQFQEQGQRLQEFKEKVDSLSQDVADANKSLKEKTAEFEKFRKKRASRASREEKKLEQEAESGISSDMSDMTITKGEKGDAIAFAFGTVLAVLTSLEIEAAQDQVERLMSLHLCKIDAPPTDEEMAKYNTMVKNECSNDETRLKDFQATFKKLVGTDESSHVLTFVLKLLYTAGLMIIKGNKGKLPEADTQASPLRSHSGQGFRIAVSTGTLTTYVKHVGKCDALVTYVHIPRTNKGVTHVTEFCKAELNRDDKSRDPKKAIGYIPGGTVPTGAKLSKKNKTSCTCIATKLATPAVLPILADVMVLMSTSTDSGGWVEGKSLETVGKKRIRRQAEETTNGPDVKIPDKQTLSVIRSKMSAMEQ